MPVLRLVGNVAWLIFIGWWLAACWLIVGIVNLIFIITIPFAIASFRIAGFALWPFGRTIEPRPTSGGMGCLTILGNALWIIFGGWAVAVSSLAAALLLTLSVIGIPFAVPCVKMAWLGLLPLGQRVVPVRRAYPGY